MLLSHFRGLTDRETDRQTDTRSSGRHLVRYQRVNNERVECVFAGTRASSTTTTTPGIVYRACVECVCVCAWHGIDHIKDTKLIQQMSRRTDARMPLESLPAQLQAGSAVN